MEKKKTSGISIVLYIIGILFLVVAVFMLVSAIAYTNTYLKSYGASFSDMWSNSLQYIIAQFMPYMGIGVVALGIGKVAKDIRNVKVEALPADTGRLEQMQQKQTELSEDMAEKIRYLSENLDTTREILGIKISEKEKRDAYRLQEMGKGLTAAFETLERKTSEPVVIEVPAAAELPASAEIAPAQTTAAGVAASQTETSSSHTAAAETAPAGPAPRIFTVSRSMTAPACPVCPASAPQIFTVSRKMTMPRCGR